MNYTITSNPSTEDLTSVNRLLPFNTPYDWQRLEKYPVDEFFAMIDALVDRYFYGFYHPLGRRMIEGDLTPDDLRFIATQEYHYYAATTWWNAFKLANSDVLAQQRLLFEPLLDELGNDLVTPGADSAHSELFLRYCEGIGLDRAEVVNAPIVPSVALAVSELNRIARERPAFEFLACSNLVVERMRPRHYHELLKTFETTYTWVSRSALRFYEVHAHLDSGHESLGRSIVASYLIDKRDQDAVFSAILRSLCLRLVMYDGIDAALNDLGRVGLKPWPNFPREPWPRPVELAQEG